jgi:hypothetical protein
MRGPGAQIVALTLALLVLVPSLACAGYGVLVQAQFVAPPALDVAIGPIQLVGLVSQPVPCDKTFACYQASPAAPRPVTSYHVWLFIAKTDPYITPHAMLLVQLPLRSRD